MEGLVAPPLIEQIWTNILWTEVYKDFCIKIFGSIVDHFIISNVAVPENFDYIRTLELLNKYADVLNPWYVLWPSYDTKDQLYDREWYVNVSIKKLYKIWDYVEEKSKAEDKRLDFDTWIKLAKSTLAHFTRYQRKSSYQLPKLEFSKEEIVLYDKSKTRPRKLFNDIHRDNAIHQELIKSIQRKYMTDEGSAKTWVTEYYKFLWILTKIKEKSFPSSKVELVWKTHMEFSADYRKFSISLYGRILYPHIYHLLEDCNDDLETYYK